MKKTFSLVLSPEEAFDEKTFEAVIAKISGIGIGENIQYRMLRRSIDARSRQIKVNVQAEVSVDEPLPPLLVFKKEYCDVKDKPVCLIVGSGPAGLFAALRLIELGIKPIIFERGKDVRDRRKDLAAINKEHVVNPDSNYCFGEGGAGTYSDGKLYTRSKKRGNIRRILEIFVAHGAKENILIDAHPHIGTNKLPNIVAALRESVLNAGGEIYFNNRVTDLIIEQDEIKGVITQNGNEYRGIGVILATGHSARDIYKLLHHKQVLIEFKPFALGVRVEHSQQLIDSIQYHCNSRSPYLPASAYSLVHQASYKGQARGVFSFCMCPGGFIVPSATSPGEVVVNGMSPSRRDSRFANSGIVVSVEAQDIQAFSKEGPLAGMFFQQAVEQKACMAAGGTQAAPAQRMIDFVNKKVSARLSDTSYQPGVVPADLWSILPEEISYRLADGFKAFGKQMRGYLTNEAQIIGVESRTSSPVRIPRNKETLEHVQIKGLFPCGEGAGYAGGIVSAAMDGETCAEMVLKYRKKASMA